VRAPLALAPPRDVPLAGPRARHRDAVHGGGRAARAASTARREWRCGLRHGPGRLRGPGRRRRHGRGPGPRRRAALVLRRGRGRGRRAGGRGAPQPPRPEGVLEAPDDHERHEGLAVGAPGVDARRRAPRAEAHLVGLPGPPAARGPRRRDDGQRVVRRVAARRGGIGLRRARPRVRAVPRPPARRRRARRGGRRRRGAGEVEGPGHGRRRGARRGRARGRRRVREGGPRPRDGPLLARRRDARTRRRRICSGRSCP